MAVLTDLSLSQLQALKAAVAQAIEAAEARGASGFRAQIVVTPREVGVCWTPQSWVWIPAGART